MKKTETQGWGEGDATYVHLGEWRHRAAAPVYVISVIVRRSSEMVC